MRVCRHSHAYQRAEVETEIGRTITIDRLVIPVVGPLPIDRMRDVEWAIGFNLAL